MRQFLIGFACSLSLAAMPVHAENASSSSNASNGTRGFTVTVDGVNAKLNAGETVQVTLQDGRTVEVGLTVNPFAQWSDDMLAFDHPGSLAVATHRLNEAITQHMMASAIGTVVIIQEYETIDPTSLKQLMMNELTKGDVKAGAELTQSETGRNLPSGTKLSGLKGVLKSRKEIKTVEVFSYGTDGRGVLLMSMIADENKGTDQAVLDKFWDTLALKF